MYNGGPMQQQQNTNTKTSNSATVITPIANTALVVEGGGQRGIFTAGILDSWLAEDFNPFSILIGTSAGAQNLSSYIAGQAGYAKKLIMQLTKHPDFFDIKRYFSKRQAMDLDWYFKQTCDTEHRLNINCAQAQLQDRQLLFAATDSDGYTPTFLEPTADNWLTMLKASSAIPYLYKKGVKIDDKYYIDGGVALPIPIQEAYHLGAKKIIVLRTVPADLNVYSPWAHKLKSWVSQRQTCPKVLDMLTEHENAYNEAVKFIHSPPQDAQIIEIAPPQKLASSVLGSSEQDLIEDYQMGYQIGLDFLESTQGRLFSTI